jgi:sugar-specific transcriptional regulator TrmB
LETSTIIEILSELGLTPTEAKILFALTQTGSATAKTITETSAIAREIVYQTMGKLKEKGLIEEIVTSPKKFKAPPIDKCLFTLLKTKNQEHSQLNRKLKQILVAFKENNCAKVEEPYQFVLIPQKTAVVNKISQAIRNASQSVDLVLSWRRFSRSIDNEFADVAKRAWARKVKFRFILENPNEKAAINYAKSFCKKSPACHIKFIPTHPKTVFGIYDEREVFIIAEPKKDLTESPALWTNNPSLISLIKDYFEILWLTAMEDTNLPCEQADAV